MTANQQIGLSLLFLIVNVAILWAILFWNRRAESTSTQKTAAALDPTDPPCLDAADILGWEFEYARSTASEAMSDRHTMVNFYLLAAGLLATGVLGFLSKDSPIPVEAAALLLWLVCGVGWIYFLSIIRLRQAWHDSAQAMNQIKDFYIGHVKELSPDELSTAFRWRTQTLPDPEKAWTVFFYSAMLIAFLNTVSYLGGAVLLRIKQPDGFAPLLLAILAGFALIFFFFQVWLYKEFLRKK